MPADMVRACLRGASLEPTSQHLPPRPSRRGHTARQTRSWYACATFTREVELLELLGKERAAGE